MSEPELQELNESIEELTIYHDRLHKEVLTIAKKLKMPQKRIESTIKEHSELNQIKIILEKLIEQRDKQRKS